jgi:GTP-sensing pleiotropic transcriptional regulator CodY
MEGNSKLSDSLLKKAQIELGSEIIKQQAIEQLREWIRCQPNIKNCRQGRLGNKKNEHKISMEILQMTCFY